MSFVRFSSRRGFAPFLVTTAALLPLGGASAAQTIQVPADYPTIQQAVDAAANGDTIHVAGGIYEESVVVADRVSLTLVGDSSARIDGGADAPAILVTGGGSISVTGFSLVSGTDALRLDSTVEPTIQSVHVLAAGGDAIHAQAISGAVSVTGSQIDQATGDGIHIELTSDVRANVIIHGNTVLSTGGDGIFAYSAEDRGGLYIDDNQVGGTGGYGIRTDCGYAYVNTNTVSDTGLDAISIYRSRSEGVVRGNTITTSGGDGVSFIGTPSPLVQDNDIRHTAGDGVDVAAPVVNILGNTIVDTGGAGVRMNEVAARELPTGTYNEWIADNRIESPGGAGIEVEGGIGIHVERNEVADAGADAISVSGDDLTVIDNAIERPAADGIGVVNLGRKRGVIVIRNSVADAGEDGVDIGSSDGVLLTSNHVDRAGECGFRIDDGAAHNVFRKNVATDCGTFGLMESRDAGVNRFARSNRFGRVQRRHRR